MSDTRCAALDLSHLPAAGYFAFSGMCGFGDWAMFIQGLDPPRAWKVGMTVVGGQATCWRLGSVLLELRPLVGSHKALRYVRAKELSRIPYFAGGILACVAGSLNPQRLILVVLSAAAATFGGTSGLLWMIEWLKGSSTPLGPERGAPANPKKLAIDRDGLRPRPVICRSAWSGSALCRTGRTLKRFGADYGQTGRSNRAARAVRALLCR